MKSIFNLLAVCLFALVQAHTVWLETKSTASQNQKHEVKVFFGELDSPTPTAKWFSDIKDIKIKVVSPSGKEFILDKTQQEKYYSGIFNTDEKGVYTISVNHLVKDTHRKMKITYQSVAFVNVGSKGASSEKIFGAEPVQIGMNTLVPQVKETKALKLYKQGKAVAKEKSVIKADNGWEMTLRTNENGDATFNPLWKGKYLVEYPFSEKVNGTHNGQEYDTDYKMITYLVDVQ
ncbi:MAG: hypothetical protein Q4C75_00535 [Bergeyella zoohelcum]|nr:hypothetical protein [Bergeyella zoohelcum]